MSSPTSNNRGHRYTTHVMLVLGVETGTGSAIVPVGAGSFTFAASDMSISEVTTEQYTKLQYYFNLYERFKLDKVEIEFMPRYDQVVPVSASYSGTTLASGDQGDQDPNFTVWEMLWLPDREDIVVRGNFDEFFQARIQNGVVRFKSTSRATIDIMPSVIRPVAVQDAGITAEFVLGDVAQLSNAPSPSPWLSTKTNSSATASPVYALNMAQQYYGVKMYSFNPYFSDTASYTYNIGTIGFTYHWSFADFDNRAIITTIDLNADAAYISSHRQLKMIAGSIPRAVLTGTGGGRNAVTLAKPGLMVLSVVKPTSDEPSLDKPQLKRARAGLFS